MTPRPKVLIVDDEPDYLSIAARIAAKAGCAVVTAPLALKGVELAEKERPSMILLDVGLPDISGFEAARRIRKVPALARTPIIFFTVRSELDMVSEGLKLGAAGYVIKPFDPDELLARIKAAVFPA
ncbi:MAG: response regulator transcription factor [Elusimicrobiales bacterium]|nr:response regulator transcription factor [Elusimicrobiales bacterium]